MPLLASLLLRRATLILACAAAFAPAAVRAQEIVRPGDYVRILAPSAADSLLTGTVIELDSGSLLLAPAPSPASRTVTVRDIERVEIRHRGGRRTLPGALLGTVIGAAAGYGITTAFVRDSNCDYLCGAAEAGGAILGGTVGLGVGALIGHGQRAPDRWAPAAVPRR